MPAITTRRYSSPSAEFYTRPLSLAPDDPFATATMISPSLGWGMMVILSKDDVPSHVEEQDSLVLRRAAQIQLLEDAYAFTNPREIKEFLASRPYLADYLFEGRRRILQIFGKHVVELCLECDKDPEEEFVGVSVIVKTNLPPDRSLDLLDRLDNEWWLNVEEHIRHSLTIMVRPV